MFTLSQQTYFFRLLCCVFAFGFVEKSHADFVIYRLPGTKLVAILEGKTKILAGRLLEYTHPAFGSMALDLEDALVVKAPTRQEEYKKLFNKEPDYLGQFGYVQSMLLFEAIARTADAGSGRTFARCENHGIQDDGEQLHAGP